MPTREQAGRTSWSAGGRHGRWVWVVPPPSGVALRAGPNAADSRASSRIADRSACVRPPLISEAPLIPEAPLIRGTQRGEVILTLSMANVAGKVVLSSGDPG